MQLPRKVEEFAPAKINLTLHVTGRRADGYHELDSLVVFADAGDTVTVAADETLRFAVTGPFSNDVPGGSDNLVYKAALAFEATQKARILLHKELPAAAGLGGGSSDAAACLRALSRVSGQPLPDAGRVLGLGADVPVCVLGDPARMQGIGERLSPLPVLPEFWMLLVNPGIAVSTGDVFKALAGEFGAPMPAQIPKFSTASDLAIWLSDQRNDLEKAALKNAPAIETCLSHLRQQQGCLLARMSGSGATCFGIFASQADVQSGADEIRRHHPAWWVSATRAADKRVS